ncbi:MAG TPA: hypothetical protein VFO84_08135 [Dehalococcoidia bacterium]|nr:hypothetical protein [Dehalococcoidia bacterium]
MSERRPGPFDDIMGPGGTPQRPEQPPEPEPRETGDPFASPPPTPEPAPPAPSEPEPPTPQPAAPTSDPFATAPVARPARPQEDQYATQAAPPPRPPVRQPSRRRDPLPWIIGGVVFVLALLVFALFLPPFELLASDDDGDSSEIADVCNGVQQSIQDDIPTVPQNLVQESPLRELTANETPCGPLNITLNLNQQTNDPSNLGFYTYDDGAYRKIADATLTTDGTAAQGQLTVLPENVIVLRATGSLIRVEGFLAQGAVDPGAAELLDVLNPVSYSPATVGDGSLVGGVDTALAGTFEVVPVIRADVQEEVIAVENILQTDVSTQAHIDAIAAQVNELDLAGIELEYGCFGSSLSGQFTEFLVSLNAAIAEEKRISVVVPDSVACANFGPYNLRDIADVADFIKLTPVRDQSIYREATIEMLRAALSTGVPRAKLLLVVSAYSSLRDPAGAVVPINGRDALAIAALPTLVEGEPPLAPGSDALFRGNRIDPSSGATGIAWNEQSMTASFSYESEGTFTYWLENSFSVPFKLDLVSRFQIAGVAVDDASDAEGLADVWIPIGQYADSGAPTLLRPNPAAFALEWRVDGGVVENEVGPSFRWTVADQAGGQCSFGPASAVDHCVTLVVSDGELRVGTELRVEVAAEEPAEGEEDGEASPTPTTTPET